MSDLLTRDEYQAIADQIIHPRSAFIDGKFQPGTGQPMESINPATGDTIATIAACGSDDVDLAVQKARDAFDESAEHARHCLQCFCAQCRSARFLMLCLSSSSIPIELPCL